MTIAVEPGFIRRYAEKTPTEPDSGVIIRKDEIISTGAAGITELEQASQNLDFFE